MVPNKEGEKMVGRECLISLSGFSIAAREPGSSPMENEVYGKDMKDLGMY